MDQPFGDDLDDLGGGEPDDKLVKWTMLPQVAEALEQLGWVRPRP